MNKVFFQLACILILFSSCAKPVADFTLGSGTPKAYTPQSFINNSKNATSYVWDFGDGTQSTEMNPTHKYLHSGQYNVKLTVSKGNKNKTMTKQVIIDHEKDYHLKFFIHNFNEFMRYKSHSKIWSRCNY